MRWLQTEQSFSSHSQAGSKTLETSLVVGYEPRLMELEGEKNCGGSDSSHNTCESGDSGVGSEGVTKERTEVGVTQYTDGEIIRTLSEGEGQPFSFRV